MPLRKRYLLVCTNRRAPDHPKGSCGAKESEEIAVRLKAELVRRALAAEVRSCTTSCLDLCEYGAVVVQEPEHLVYGAVVLGDVEEIVDAMANERTVERLLVSRSPQQDRQSRA